MCNAKSVRLIIFLALPLVYLGYLARVFSFKMKKDCTKWLSKASFIILWAIFKTLERFISSLSLTFCVPSSSYKLFPTFFSKDTLQTMTFNKMQVLKLNPIKN